MDYTNFFPNIKELFTKLQSIKLRCGPKKSAAVGIKYCREVHRESMIKLQKLSHYKFSVIPQDFPQWKKEFIQMVLPGHLAVEIELFLRY